MLKILWERFINRSIPLAQYLPLPDGSFNSDEAEQVTILAIDTTRQCATVIVDMHPRNLPERVGELYEISFAVLRPHYISVLRPNDLPTAKELTTLEQFLVEQERFMVTLGVPSADDIKPQEYLTHPAFKAAVDGLVTEAAEVLDALSVITKPWKLVSIDEMRANVLEESLDVLFMLLEVWAMAGLSGEQVAGEYLNKLEKNYRRAAKSIGQHFLLRDGA